MRGPILAAGAKALAAFLALVSLGAAPPANALEPRPPATVVPTLGPATARMDASAASGRAGPAAKGVLQADAGPAVGGLLLAQVRTEQGTLPLPPAGAKGGNKALMEDWARKKSALRDQVVQDLRAKGLLPRDGQVVFEARVAPDPKNPDKAVVRIESLSISENPKGGGAMPMTGQIFAPRDPGGRIEAGSVPAGGTLMRETIPIVGGKPQSQGKP